MCEIDCFTKKRKQIYLKNVFEIILPVTGDNVNSNESR